MQKTIELETKSKNNLLTDKIENAMAIQDYMVFFSTQTESYCVGYVDMVSSTKISAYLGIGKACRYYQIFLNSISGILTKYGGTVIKNVGDSLLYYFPESKNGIKKFGLLSCIEGSLAILEAHDKICNVLQKEGLPDVNYRISADYGAVVLVKQNNTENADLMGPPVNLCSKINRMAGKNGFVIGGDLYHMVKTLTDYTFKGIEGYSSGLKYSYPVFSVRRKIIY
ncbi:MAG: adenylate/guanylate cyclase domain-containing protein [Nitrosopumilaceae archaeon]